MRSAIWYANPSETRATWTSVVNACRLARSSSKLEPQSSRCSQPPVIESPPCAASVRNAGLRSTSPRRASGAAIVHPAARAAAEGAVVIPVGDTGCRTDTFSKISAAPADNTAVAETTPAPITAREIRAQDRSMAALTPGETDYPTPRQDPTKGGPGQYTPQAPKTYPEPTASMGMTRRSAI